MCMGRQLQTEIKQRKPFPSVEVMAYLNLIRTADQLMRQVAEALKPFGITPTQYNVLRILRGAEPHGSMCSEVADRMVTRDPDVTRLLDRMEGRALITRERDEGDRRVVRTRITVEGRRVLEQLEAPLQELHARQLAHLGKTRVRDLITLLETLRRGEG
ncbi:MAG: MarR family transcriptional regulator [Gemmatimonadetes bacterium]|nr:MarR family transcriptional regulator [Gemmatimonadota bacterium]